MKPNSNGSVTPQMNAQRAAEALTLFPVFEEISYFLPPLLVLIKLKLDCSNPFYSMIRGLPDFEYCLSRQSSAFLQEAYFGIIIGIAYYNRRYDIKSGLPDLIKICLH